MPRKPRRAVHLGGGLPLQQMLVRHRHAPQRRRRRRQRYPRLIRQQPQPNKRLHHRAAGTREYARVAARPLPAAPMGKRRLRQRKHQPCHKCQQRRPCRDGDGCSRHEEARADGGERRRGDETAPQRIYQPPALYVAKSLHEYKGEVLPIAAYPAVQAFIVCQRAGGKTVGKFRVAHIRTAQIRALRRVVTEYPSLRE